MNDDKPAVWIEFDPETWAVAAVYFKANSDTQTEKMTAILAEGMRTAAQPGGGARYAQ